jgi:glycine/D-amino acid oxidase-like deaminating enzyme
MTKHRSQRIVIVGGGVAGLAIAARLAQAGLPVTVLEASRLGQGATTRNQGTSK